MLKHFTIFGAVFLLVTCIAMSGTAQDLTLDVFPGTPMPNETDLEAHGCILIHEYSADKFPQVPGPETTINIYRCAKRMLAVYQFSNLRIYAVAIKTERMPVEGCIDEDALGFCTRIVQEDEEFSVDFKAYGIQTRPFSAYDTDILDLP